MFLGNYQMKAFWSTFAKKCKSPAGNDKTKFELRMENGWVVNNSDVKTSIDSVPQLIYYILPMEFILLEKDYMKS